MAITDITSLAQLEDILNRSPEKLTVINFHATRIKECAIIAPVYIALSRQYGNVNFLKCDVGVAHDVADYYTIQAMPTFLFLKGQISVDRVIGANSSGIDNALQRYSSGPTPADFSGSDTGDTVQTSRSSSKARPRPRARVSSVDADLMMLFCCLWFLIVLTCLHLWYLLR